MKGKKKWLAALLAALLGALGVLRPELLPAVAPLLAGVETQDASFAS